MAGIVARPFGGYVQCGNVCIYNMCVCWCMIVIVCVTACVYAGGSCGREMGGNQMPGN